MCALLTVAESKFDKDAKTKRIAPYSAKNTNLCPLRKVTKKWQKGQMFNICLTNLCRPPLAETALLLGRKGSTAGKGSSSGEIISYFLI